VGKGGFAEAGRAVEEQVVQRLVALFGGIDGDAEIVLQLRLADELLEAPRPQRDVDRLVVVLRLAGDDALSRRWCRLRRMPVLLGDIIVR